MTQSNFEEQIAATEQRYTTRSNNKIENEENLTVGGDWRQVETPERVMQRINALGLNKLASQLIATETVTQSVPSL